MRRILILTAVLAAAGLNSCRRSARPPGDTAVRVFVSIPPQAYFAERIGGGDVRVEVLVGTGQDPHTFEPTLKQMTRLGRAQVFFRAGMPFEKGLMPKLKSVVVGLTVIDVRKGIELKPAAKHGHHRAEGHHHEKETDPHFWLSPRLAQQMSRTMCDGLCKADPARADGYRRNLESLLSDLEALDRRIAERLAPVKGRTLYVFHPAFGYFAEAYGLKQRALEAEGKAPSLREIERWTGGAGAEGIGALFVRKGFARKSARTIAAEIGASMVELDPLGRQYVRNLEEMAEAIRAGLLQKRPGDRRIRRGLRTEGAGDGRTGGG